jgi:hypothetical protein
MRRRFIGSILVLGFAVAAEASPVNELELDGTATNNTKATAQTIPTSAFTLPVPPTAFDPPGFRTAALFGRGGGSDVDLFRISGHGQLVLDIDLAVFPGFPSIDTVLFIFDSSGALIAGNDDGIPDGDPGSFSSHESLLFFNLPGPGVYYVGILRFGNWGCDTLGAPHCNIDEGWFVSNGPQPEDGPAYLLYLSLEHPHRVPAPGTLILVGVACGVGAITSAFWRRGAM